MFLDVWMFSLQIKRFLGDSTRCMSEVDMLQSLEELDANISCYMDTGQTTDFQNTYVTPRAYEDPF